MADATESAPPVLQQTVLDTEDVRGLAEFYRVMFGLRYREGDEPPAGEADDPDWVTLTDADGVPRLAFQHVDHLPPSTWPEAGQPQMLHLDTVVPTVADLFAQRRRALDLGARELLDRSDDADEPLFVFADPSGHPFCVFVG